MNERPNGEYGFAIVFRSRDPNALDEVVKFLKECQARVVYLSGPHPPSIRLFVKHYALHPIGNVKGGREWMMK